MYKMLVNTLLPSTPYILLTLTLSLHFLNVISLCTLNTLLVVFVLVFLLGPLAYKYSYQFQQSTIFLNFVAYPSQSILKYPSRCGLTAVSHFHLRTDDDVTLGVWYVAPENESRDWGEGKDHSSLLGDGRDVVIYHHGNAGNRSASHRIELYKILRRQFHVIAFDYRDYGDSSRVTLSERGVVNDSMFVFKWVRERATGNVFIWGHSLGTAISTHMLALAAAENLRPAGLILESPFNNLRDEMKLYPFIMLLQFLPWFSYTVLDAVQENKLLFKTDEHINNVDCPILILHAKDDMIVPFKLGRKLYQSAKEKRMPTQGEIHFHPFDKGEQYGHTNIWRAPHLSDLIKKFVGDCAK
ncbi:hypothetical protein PPYR_14199 [Photinus pyralis]|uniref:AB hydrolase-1 domain-containing protein n=1 Tax=Photinus pyralis TaxID=7054 RepID=A0A5N4A4J5_PHOPY|nr:lysophosphatidylserine lipase ABHD12-like [Photinus pyralis]KAB0792240.1 hypothetical protein PPYR_14199 [Photinus pyralis]